MVQWIRICLPVQGTQVQSLAWEDSTCRGAPKPERHNYWAGVLKLLKPACPRVCALQQETPPQWNPRTLQLERSPRTARKTQCSQKWIHKFFKKKKKNLRLGKPCKTAKLTCCHYDLNTSLVNSKAHTLSTIHCCLQNWQTNGTRIQPYHTSVKVFPSCSFYWHQ